MAFHNTIQQYILSHRPHLCYVKDYQHYHSMGDGVPHSHGTQPVSTKPEYCSVTMWQDSLFCNAVACW